MNWIADWTSGPTSFFLFFLWKKNSKLDLESLFRTNLKIYKIHAFKIVEFKARSLLRKYYTWVIINFLHQYMSYYIFFILEFDFFLWKEKKKPRYVWNSICLRWLPYIFHLNLKHLIISVKKFNQIHLHLFCFSIMAWGWYVKRWKGNPRHPSSACVFSNVFTTN